MSLVLLVAGCGSDEADNAGDVDLVESIPDAPLVADRADTVEGLAEEYLGQIDEFAVALAESDDTAGAQALAGLSPLAVNKLHAIARRLEALAVPEPATREAISRQIESHQEELERSLGSREDFFGRLAPSLRPTVENAMGEFTNALGEVAPVIQQYFSAEMKSPPPPEPGAPSGSPLPESLPEAESLPARPPGAGGAPVAPEPEVEPINEPESADPPSSQIGPASLPEPGQR